MSPELSFLLEVARKVLGVRGFVTCFRPTKLYGEPSSRRASLTKNFPLPAEQFRTLASKAAFRNLLVSVVRPETLQVSRL